MDNKNFKDWEIILTKAAMLAVALVLVWAFVGMHFENRQAQAAESKFQISQAPLLDLARGQSGGNLSFVVRGHTVNADNTDATDFWGGSATTPVFVAPTEARVHTLVSTSTADVLAVATFTMADAGTEDEVLLIGAKTYTLRDIMSETDGFVLREVAATDTLDNIIAAINLGAGAGTKYATATTANVAPTSAVAGAGETMTLYSETAIVTTSTVNSGFGAATAVLGTGAQVVTVRGLVDWDTAETTTSFNMTGVTGITTSEYVWINEIKVTQSGTGTGPNIGVITATAATDSSISSKIPALDGDSRNGFYAWPSTRNLYVGGFGGSMSGVAITILGNVVVLHNPDPDNQLTNFNSFDEFSLGLGASACLDYRNWARLTGPGIIKTQITTTADDTVASVHFSVVVVPNNL